MKSLALNVAELFYFQHLPTLLIGHHTATHLPDETDRLLSWGLKRAKWCLAHEIWLPVAIGSRYHSNCCRKRITTDRTVGFCVFLLF